MKEQDEEELIEESKSKIVIAGDIYQLRQVSDSDFIWDLYLKRKKKNGEEKWVVDAYGISLTHAMHKIINYKICCKLNGKSVNMKQYLQIWQKLAIALRKELKGL